MAHRLSEPAPAAAQASQSGTRALRAALFAALGLNLASGCGADADDATESMASAWSASGLVCRDPARQPRLGAADEETGYESCDGGWFHRSSARECPSALPRASPVTGSPGDSCDDASCAGPHAFCIVVVGPGASVLCTAGCVRDDECGPGQICFCDDPVGRCVRASCTTDADCPGSLCVGTPNRSPCGGPDATVFACADRRDECLTGNDCTIEKECSVVESSQSTLRQCRFAPECGRPFLVGGSPRRAGVEARSDWASASGAPQLGGLDARARAVLAAHWTELGVMEHASVAAFARFVLELLAAGAPPDLVGFAQRALGDELEHARLCFGLASAYAETPLGPGALSARGALDDTSFRGCLMRAIHEACVGETLAAVEAQEALAGASDPAVLAVLSQVVRDESAHAELGWRFLKWALVAAPELRELAQAELQRAVDAALAASRLAPDSGTDPCPELECHGLCPAPRRHAARRRALRQIVMPLAGALFEDPSTQPRAAVDGAALPV